MCLIKFLSVLSYTKLSYRHCLRSDGSGYSITPEPSRLSHPLLYIQLLPLNLYASMQSRGTSWCFTLNNYTQDEYERVCEICRSQGSYFVIGKEVGDRGTPHLQGYIRFSKRYYFRYVSNVFGSRFHIEGARGTARQNREYCTKGGDFIEGGNLPEDNGGERRKGRDEYATEFRGCLDEGSAGIIRFATSYPGVWGFSGSQLLRNTQSLLLPVERPNIRVEWVYGEPGVGKSRYAHEKMPRAYIKEPRTKWWNGYLQEKEVIIDDFGPQGIDINHLLRWFDRYKCLVEIKGGMTSLYAESFIVTSNFHPEELFRFGDETHKQLPALLRRVQLIKLE